MKPKTIFWIATSLVVVDLVGLYNAESVITEAALGIIGLALVATQFLVWIVDMFDSVMNKIADDIERDGP